MFSTGSYLRQHVTYRNSSLCGVWWTYANVFVGLLNTLNHNLYLPLQVFVPHTIFLVGVSHTSLFFIFFIHKYRTCGICAYVPFSMLLFMYNYMHTCDRCHDGIFSPLWLPNSSIYISSSWLCVRNSSASFDVISTIPLTFN